MFLSKAGWRRNPNRRFWILGLLLIAALTGALESAWDLLADLGEILFELVEENLEGFYRKFAKLDMHRAQMATAYTYLLLAVALLLLFGPRLWQQLQVRLREIERIRLRLAARCRILFERARGWWERLDFFGKIAAAGVALLGVIPLLLLLSYGLGSALAELL